MTRLTGSLWPNTTVRVAGMWATSRARSIDGTFRCRIPENSNHSEKIGDPRASSLRDFKQ